jgi:predicted ferric reductase
LPTLGTAGRALPWLIALLAGGLVAAGAGTADLTGGAQTADLGSTHLYWYLGRASGFVAFTLLLASLVLGLAVSSRVFDGLLVRPWVYDMHQFLSLYVIVVSAFHAAVFLLDPYVMFGLDDLLVPFAASYRPLAVGVGTIVLYGTIIVSFSFYVRQFIGQRTWRLLHYVTFALFFGALVHGISAGTDTREPLVQVYYLGSGLLALFFTFYRILATRRAPVRREVAHASQLVR